MEKTNILKKLNGLKERLVTVNNGVLIIGILIAINWTWSSLATLGRIYTLQKRLDIKQRQQKVVEIEIANLTFQKKYLQSDEYKELAARKYLGLAEPGEKVLILPPALSSQGVDKSTTIQKTEKIEELDNFTQWVNFLLGKNRRNLQKDL